MGMIGSRCVRESLFNDTRDGGWCTRGRKGKAHDAQWPSVQACYRKSLRPSQHEVPRGLYDCHGLVHHLGRHLRDCRQRLPQVPRHGVELCVPEELGRLQRLRAMHEGIASWHRGHRGPQAKRS